MTNNLTKDNILNCTSVENIYLHFLKLSDFPKGNISSPFTNDEKPSFKLSTNGSFKCYSSGKHGDVWQFVADISQLDNKTQFNELLNIIAEEMNLSLPTINNDLQNGVKILQNSSNYPALQSKTLQINGEINNLNSHNGLQKEVKSASKTDLKLNVTTREFTNLDLEYWKKLGVEKELLKKYQVHSISESYFIPNKIFKTKENSVSFAYEIDGIFKKYTPEQPNCSVKKSIIPHLKNIVFGLHQQGTEKKENLIICEGEKDVIIATSRGFNAVSFGSATTYPKKEQIEKLQTLCDNLFICYDNDDPGEIGRNTIVNKFSQIITLQLPKNDKIKGYDLTDYFQDHKPEDFQKIIDLAVKNKKVVEVSENTDLTIFHKTENYILKNYDLRFDIISNEIEISQKDKNLWEELNENSLYVEMQKKHIKIAIGNLKAILTSDFVPKFNPLVNYFENLPPWDNKTDNIKQFLDYVELEPGEDREQFIYQFRKWCVRAVKCSTIEGYFNKQAFVLSDDAKGQSIGKTTYIRYLVPNALNKYYCENLPEDKDAIKRLGQNFIINLDELATLSRTDINKLKSMFSSDKIKTRLPYGSKDIIISRVANFIGSTNMSTFLVDESGSVRWLCFIVKKINFNYTSEFNIDNLWMQAYSLSKNESFKEAMTPEDIKQNEIRNDKFQILSPERELIPKYFEVPVNNENIEFLSSTAILHHISVWTHGIRLTPGGIGKAMPKCGFLRKKHKNEYGYWVVKKPTQ